jgi:4-amino-4-deoxy-L-arabinose transferase-like glycosyltransferase
VVPLALLVAALLAYLPGLDAQYVWTKDEARPGLVAKEMLSDGHWAIPRFGGRLYVEKPPLFPWLVVLASPWGVSEWTLRLPSVLAAAVTLVATYLLGARLASHAAGAVAAGVLASSFVFFEWARTGRMEMVLVLWITLGFWSVVRWFDGGQLRDAAALGLWMGLGVLTKGPIALIPLAGALALVILDRPVRRSWGAAALAGAIAIGLPLLWLVAAVLNSPDAADYMLGLGPQFVTELQQPPPRSPFFPLVSVGTGFLPWTFLMPVVIWFAVRHRREGRRVLIFLLAWVGAIALTFTLVVRPRAPHFLPLYPPLALIVGWAWHVASPATRRWVLGATAAIAAIVALAGTAFWATTTLTGLPFPDWIPERSAGVRVAMLVALVAAPQTWWLARRGRVGQAGLLFCGATLVFFLAIDLGVHTPKVNSKFPTLPAATRFATHLPRDTQVIFLDRKLLPSLLFYLPQRAHEVATSDALLGVQPRDVYYVLFVEPDFSHVRGRLGRPLTVLEEIEIDRTVYVLARIEASIDGQ